MTMEIIVKGTDIEVKVEDGEGTKCIDFTRFLLESRDVKAKEMEKLSEYKDGPRLLAGVKL